MKAIGTSVDQSLSLIDYGVSSVSADLYWSRHIQPKWNTDNLYWENYMLSLVNGQIPKSTHDFEFLPAWSLNALISEVLPYEIVIRKKFYYWLQLSKEKQAESDAVYHVRYRCPLLNKILVETKADDYVTAAVEMCGMLHTLNIYNFSNKK
jgi:hypothetical protein